MSPIVKFHLIFPYDVVSSPHPACQKHLRELLTGKIETHPCRVSCQDGGFRKGFSHRNNVLLKVFMLYKAKHFLYRKDGRE